MLSFEGAIWRQHSLAGAAVCSDDSRALQQLLWHRSEPC